MRVPVPGGSFIPAKLREGVAACVARPQSGGRVPEFADGRSQFRRSEVRPHGAAEDQFGVSRFPQQKIAQAVLAPGADDQVDRRSQCLAHGLARETHCIGSRRRPPAACSRPGPRGRRGAPRRRGPAAPRCRRAGTAPCAGRASASRPAAGRPAAAAAARPGGRTRRRPRRRGATARSRPHTSAIASRGSTAPVLVVPAVETTRKGRSPARRSASIAARRASTLMRKCSSTGTVRTRSGRMPASRADLATEAWA